ncbi:MAG TPA: adenylosuccinate lyase [Candidatus Sulfotelmatobacter sp.]|nr:adenylosuccinate lyase [Candidatus Sulfotelmatobacter sp.]
MIERYSRPEMRRIWTDAHRLELWLEVELAVTGVRETRGEVPAGTVAGIRARARLDAARMQAIEAEVHHDVIAFLTMLAESAGDGARHLHAGLTSSDLVDTALALQLQEASRQVSSGLAALRGTCWNLAQRHRHTAMAGRTHGIHAEPISFGLKCLVWSEELGRSERRLGAAARDLAVGKFSGAVGTLAHLEPAIEEQALAKLGLEPEPVANQVVQRDRHAALLATFAVLAGTLEKIATEIRHLQRSEVREAAEPFGAGQKGSSAMPHKRNPVRSERIAGLARLVRGYAMVGFENQPLWHERDISHSSAERVILPDAFEVVDFMLAELDDILSRLVVDERRMRANLEAGGGLVYSQRVLLALTDHGLPRDEAYRIVQQHALAALDGGPAFREALSRDPAVRARLSSEELEACFTFEPFFRHLDALYARAAAPR